MTHKLDFTQFETLTFDCYGTLIDWESGIASAIDRILREHSIHLDRDEILTAHSEFEPKHQSSGYLPYREVLARVVDDFARRYSFTPTESQRASLAESIRDWPPFPDSTESLNRLHKRFKLVIISNIDDDLFAYSQGVLNVKFDQIITAAQSNAYKPSHAMFNHAFGVILTPKDRILHVAQSLFHDIAPANQLGLMTVWVNRRKGQPGSGATPGASATPDIEVATLAELADLIGV